MGGLKDFAAIHTTHVGNLVNSSKSSLVSGVSVPAVWAETVRAENNRAAMVAKRMMNSERRLLVEAAPSRLQHSI